MDKATQQLMRLLLTTVGKEGKYLVEPDGEHWLVTEKSLHPMWSGNAILYDWIENETEARVICALCNLGLDQDWDQIQALVEALID